MRSADDGIRFTSWSPDTPRFRAEGNAGIPRHAVTNDSAAALGEHGGRSIPTVMVPQTDRRRVGLADLALHCAVVQEAAAR
jgi:hypothetical protein